MTPAQLSAQLRRIAAKIDNSKNPSKQLVTKELRRVVATLRVASSPVMMSWFEGGYYTPQDIIRELPPANSGPVWASIYSFGWVISFQDPSTIEPSTLVDGPGTTITWKEMADDDEIGYAISNLKRYGSVDEFVSNDEVIQFIGLNSDPSDEHLREPVIQQLLDNGFVKAAEKIKSELVKW